jgi:hypothetical protein
MLVQVTGWLLTVICILCLCYKTILIYEPLWASIC